MFDSFEFKIDNWVINCCWFILFDECLNEFLGGFIE